MTVSQVPAAEVRIVRKPSGLHNHWLGGAIHTLEAGPDSRYAFSCTLATMAVDGGPAWHVHAREEEFFYIRRGRYTFEAAGSDPVTIGPGALISLPVGVPHQFNCIEGQPVEKSRRTGTAFDSDQFGEVILWTSPGGNAQFFLELSNPLSEDNDASVPPNIKAMSEVGRAYGITMLGPDLDALAHIDDGLAGGRRASVATCDEAKSQPMLGGTGCVLATASATGGQCELVHLTLPPGATTPPLQHGRYGLGVVVLSGGVEVSGQSAPTDSLISVPFGAAYSLHNPHNEPSELLTLSTPGGLVEAWASGEQAGVFRGEIAE